MATQVAKQNFANLIASVAHVVQLSAAGIHCLLKEYDFSSGSVGRDYNVMLHNMFLFSKVLLSELNPLLAK